MTDLQKSLKGLRILAVEDNELNRMVLQVILKKCEVFVSIAHNGQEAIDLIQHQEFDLVLMDVQMPIVDGLEATKYIREELKLTTPIIGLSANAMREEVEICKEAGMNEYISKPYTEEVLISVLTKFKSNSNTKSKILQDDYAAVFKALEQKISKTYADKIVGIFRERLPTEILLLEQAIEERDFKLMEERAQYQSGSMSSLHFKQGYQLAYAAERAAVEGEAAKAEEAVGKLIAYLRELVTYLGGAVN
jgi:CheY-like chemotaxis protein